jgi:Fe-S cluster biogenesis protein NfuA/nitrite reductase/ring-hydroxylating ferredoxin subunit
MAATAEAPADALVRRIEELSERLDAIEDPVARETAQELMAATLELYGEGLERIFLALDDVPEVRDALVADGVVASLLLIHDLYPVELEVRVQQALDSVRPYMESHGGNVEVAGIEEGVLRLRLQGSCHGCRASASTLELAIKRALDEAAPDLLGIEVEGVVEPVLPRKPLSIVGEPPAWVDVGVTVESGTVVPLDGSGLVVANVSGTLLAYRDSCAGCGAPLAGGALEAGVLTCGSCSRQFALTLAGRLVGDEELQLEPMPLLEEDGRVRVAVA